MNMRCISRLGGVVLLLCAARFGWCATVDIPARAVVRGEQVTLGEVARIEADEAERARLAAVVLGASPSPGAHRQFSLEMIRVRLRHSGFNPDAMTLACPQPLEVTRLATAVGGDVPVAVGRAWLQARMAPEAHESVEFTPTRTPAEIVAPMGEMRWECAPAGADAGPIRTVLVTLLVDEQPAWRGMIGFSVRRFAPVLVAATAVRRGAALDPAAFVAERREVTLLKGQPWDDAEALRGMRAAATLSAGAILTREAVEPMPLVRRNEPLRITATLGAVVVTTLATACEDGAEGAVIRVRNTATRQDYFARVTGAGQATLVW